jgi:hypothetical protein
MCNAAKHPPGCSCGFGPPYPPSYSTGEVTEWAEEVLDNPSVARRGLREMAWDEEAVGRFLQEYLAIRDSDLPRDTMISRIRQLLGMRRKVVEAVVEDWINVPLYQFGAPNVPGAVVEYSEGNSLTEGAGWLVKVFGIGTGETASLQVNKARTFVAQAGTCKLIYIPVKLRVSHIAVCDGERLVGRGHEARVASQQEGGDEHLRRRGVRSLPPRTCCEGPVDPRDIVEAYLSGDMSGAIHRDSRFWETDIAREVSVKLEKLLDVSAVVRVRRVRRLGL